MEFEDYTIYDYSFNKVFNTNSVLIYGKCGDLLYSIGESKGEFGSIITTDITTSKDFNKLLDSKDIYKMYSQLFKKRIFKNDSYLIVDNINIPIMKMNTIHTNINDLSNFLFINSVLTEDSLYFNTKIQDSKIEYNYIVITEFSNLGEIYHKYIHCCIEDYSHFLYILEIILSEGNLFVFDTVKNIIGFIEIC
jgi:hypothetical protein